MHKKIREAKESHNFTVFRSYCTNSPTWSDVVELMYKSSNSSNAILPDDKRNISSTMMVYNRLDPVIYGALDFPESGIYKKFFENEAALNEIFGHSLLTCNPKVIANLVGTEGNGYGIHPDDHDVILWHCEGQVEWRIYKDFPESDFFTTSSSLDYESVILNPGDIIFCPSGVVHQVVVSEPRASFVFGFRMPE
jgi:hypothetical protein